MNKIALLLSGLGFEKGTSVFEIPFVLRTLEKRGMIPQPAVPSETFKGHGFMSKAPQLKKDVELLFNDKVFTFPELSPKDLDGAIILGGKGTMNVLSNYEGKKEGATANPQFTDLVRGLKVRNKPIATLGYGAVPVVFALLKAAKPILTCGGDPQVQDILERLGTMVINTTADNVVIDQDNMIYSTHGITPSSSIYRASLGIEQVVNALVDAILEKKTQS